MPPPWSVGGRRYTAWSIVIFSSFVRVHESTNNDLFLSFVQFIVLDPYISTLWGGSKETPPEIQDKIETASLAWTPKILVNGIGSILTLGSKGGYITLWHVTNPKDVRCVHSSRLSEDSWVTQLSWSPWMVENGRHVSILAYALSNGEVNARKVTFDTSDPLANIEISEDIIAAGNQSAHPCTVLCWSPTLIEARSMALDVNPLLSHVTFLTWFDCDQ